MTRYALAMGVAAGCIGLGWTGGGVCRAAAPEEAVMVEVEEDVYSYVSPNNGSGPLWSYGCTSIARVGEDVVVSQMETGEGVPPLCNTRWRLLRRTHAGWATLAEAEGYRQREPTSLGVASDGSLFLYVNDSTEPPGTKYGPCLPHLLRFSLDAPPNSPGEQIMPEWAGETYFTDHSYRGYAADSGRDELLMLNINAKTSAQHWCLLSRDGDTVGNGVVSFPIRACYPQVALRNRAGYVMAVGDIVEPVEEWRTYKFEQTQQKWDYVFRILYFTWSPDLTAQGFGEPIEIANLDATAGHITNQDMWIGPAGEAWVLYSEQEVQNALMRDKFFPDGSLDPILYLAVIRNGAVAARRILVPPERHPGCARFHETPDGRVFALAYLGAPEPHNALIQVFPEPERAEPLRVPFKTPFGSFCLAGVRAGNAPSNTIDVLGHSTSGGTLSYGRIRIK
ncbi:MAG: hypothetical protein JXR94_23335 [Candidatus Hydrogenedentes bacterium]|nr:hypothetical protein [Candidatus Hydrogenedentota bacterium]